jgi:hypothetical protein
LNFKNLDLFRLPARSRSGEGRNFDIRISDFSTACLIQATPDYDNGDSEIKEGLDNG